MNGIIYHNPILQVELHPGEKITDITSLISPHEAAQENKGESAARNKAVNYL